MQPESWREVQDWLNRAEYDFMAAGQLLEGSVPWPATVAYLSQQAAEKALKGILVKDAGGRIVGASTIARDITEKKRLKEVLQQGRGGRAISLSGATERKKAARRERGWGSVCTSAV